MVGRALAALVSFSVLFAGVLGALINGTLDDSEVGPWPSSNRRLATIGYYPPANGYWGTHEGSPDTMVDKEVEAVKAFGGSFTAASSFAGSTPRKITIDFFGTSITAFFTLSNRYATECDFTLDGEQLIELRRQPDSTNERFSYQVPAVNYSNLSPSLHRLEINVGRYSDDFSRLNFISFDYAQFTYDTAEADAYFEKSSSQPESSPNAEKTNREDTQHGNQTAAIVGGTIGGAAVLAAALLVIFFVRSRRLQGEAHSSSDSSSMDEKTGIPGSLPPNGQSRRPSRWMPFGSSMPHGNGPPTSGPSTTLATSSPFASQPEQRGSDTDRHSMFSAMSTSTKAHPLYLHIGPDGNSQWLSSPSEVHRLNLNSTPPQPHRRYSDGRLDALGLQLNTIPTPKTPPQPISPGSTSFAAAARELQPSYEYPMPDLPVNYSEYHR